jgi:hypothetical protein
MIPDLEYKRIKGELQKEYGRFYKKMKRLRSDLYNLKDDFEFIKSGGLIVYVADFTEIVAYINPKIGMQDYLFDIQVLSDKEKEAKKIKRWYRLRELLYNEKNRVMILPPHLEELNKEVMFHARRFVMEQYALLGIVNEFQKKVEDDEKYEKALNLLEEIGRLQDGEERAGDLMSDFFDDYSIRLAALTYERKGNYKEEHSELQRIQSLLKDGHLQEYNKYKWNALVKNDKCVSDEINKIQIIDRYDDFFQISELFGVIRNKRILSNLVDAVALIYLDEINGVLKRCCCDNLRIQMVTSALSVFTLVESLSGNYLDAYVRHPKFLPALMENKEYIDDVMIRDIDKIIGAIDAYIKKHSSDKRLKYMKEIEDDLKQEISSVWGSIENKMFLKEVSFIKEEEIYQVKYRGRIVRKDDSGVSREKELLMYFHTHRSAFNTYIHCSYGIVFDQMVMFYIQRLARYGKYNAIYIKSGMEDRSIKILWQSKAIRSIVEINNKELILKIQKDGSVSIDIKAIIATIVDNRQSDNDEYEYEVKIIKAMCMLTAEQWHLADIICRDALRYNNVARYEAYYLLSLIQRKFVFDKIKENKREDAIGLYKEAKKGLSEAKNIKNRKDYRFVFSEAAMKLERMYFPGENIGSISDISANIENCVREMKSIDNEGLGDYGDYLKFRCYQILMSFYIMWYIGFYGKYDKNENREKVVNEWYENIILYDMGKPQYKQYSVTIDIIENAFPLMLKSEGLTKREYVYYFDAVYRGCKSLKKGGFYKMLVHDLKVKLYRKMLKKYNMNDMDIKRWPELLNCEERFVSNDKT